MGLILAAVAGMFAQIHSVVERHEIGSSGCPWVLRRFRFASLFGPMIMWSLNAGDATGRARFIPCGFTQMAPCFGTAVNLWPCWAINPAK